MLAVVVLNLLPLRETVLVIMTRFFQQIVNLIDKLAPMKRDVAILVNCVSGIKDKDVSCNARVCLPRNSLNPWRGMIFLDAA